MLETPVAETEVIDGKRETFFKLLYGKSARGLMCIAFIAADNKRDYTESFYNYPDDLPKVLEVVRNNEEKYNLYFCPQLFREPKRVKHMVEYTPNVWADLDHCEPHNLLVEPSIVLESSPGRFQGFWLLSKLFDPDDVENIAQRIAYRHADQGADKSGWDLTQLLRIPYTPNHKYKEKPLVTPRVAKANYYQLTDFDELYPNVEAYQRVNIPLPTISDDLNAQDLLNSAKMTMNPIIWGLYAESPDEGTWSERLWKLLLFLFESGFNMEQTYVIATNSNCNKYARDGRPAMQLWKDVVRAHTKYVTDGKIAFGDSKQLDPSIQYDLLTKDERDRVLADGDCFIERYIQWASSLSDAAKQYHQAGAFVALSSMLCGSVRLPTSFGSIIPNLWFMILGDTTLTRKTTAMDNCMDLLEEIDPDLIMATDGSIEGMSTGLSTRPNRPSIFLRDEFSGLIEQMNKKDYMSGMPEFLTKIYDGKAQKRILKKEVIEIRSPRLILFAGGIRNAVTAALTYENIASGFIPRFIFITAESDITKVKPIGPPTVRNNDERNAIGVELLKLNQYYNRDEEVAIPETDSVITRKKFFDVEMTEAAWLRYNELEAKLTKFGLDSQQPEIMTPIGDRLAKSILKAAVLIAVSKHLSERTVVSEVDILRAISYGEKWFTHTRAIVAKIGMGAIERKIDSVLKTIAIEGQRGTNRATIMKIYKLSSREYASIMDTLEQRGEVIRVRSSRGETLHASVHTQND